MECNESYENRESKWALWAAIKLFKAGGGKCSKSFTNIFDDILFKDKLPEECMLSLLGPIFKGKGDSLIPNYYRGINLFELAFLKNYTRSFWMGVFVRW